jgi:23S rRNA (uracil1939-C5)-methyltransferase
VSCDAAALGRDAALLRARGFDLERSTLVDAFPHTPHVEVVSRFARGHGS